MAKKMKNKTKSVNINKLFKKTKKECRKIFKNLDNGIHYKTIVPLNGEGSRTILLKAGAEYIAKAFGWRVEFYDVTHFNSPTSIERDSKQISVRVDLFDREGKKIGQGVGGRNLALDDSDINTSMKMAFKSAFVDVVLRVSGLAQYMSQDNLSDEIDNALPTFSKGAEAVKQQRNGKEKRTEEVSVTPSTNIPMTSDNTLPTATKTESVQQKTNNVQHKKLVEHIMRLGGDSANELPSMFGRDSLNEMTINELLEAEQMIAASNTFVIANKGDNNSNENVNSSANYPNLNEEDDLILY